jgi:hypothetical protein
MRSLALFLLIDTTAQLRRWGRQGGLSTRNSQARARAHAR